MSLPGRFCVLVPNDSTVGVSKKIESDHERHRLRKIARQLCPQGCGLIVRTVAAGKDFETLKADLDQRGATRMDDKTSDASMEKRKKDGYF